VPVIPGHAVVYTGAVTGVSTGTGVGIVDIGFRAATDLGDHVSGTATLTFPLDR